MVSTGGKAGGNGKASPSLGETTPKPVNSVRALDLALSGNINSRTNGGATGDGDDDGPAPAVETAAEEVKEARPAAVGQGASAGASPRTSAAATPAADFVAAGENAATEANEPGMQGIEAEERGKGKGQGKEREGAKADGKEPAPAVAAQAVASPAGDAGGERTVDAGGGNGGGGNDPRGASGGEAPPASKSAAKRSPEDSAATPDEPKETAREELRYQRKQQQQQMEQQPDAAADREPQSTMADAVPSAVVQIEPAPVVAAVESSGDDDDDDGEDDDGFRVVVGREIAHAAPAAPAKRFIRGTNTLVNTAASTSGIGGAKEPGGGGGAGTAGSKPASAAAGIASLVPSKGAPVATARPTLKAGEYPPTAELQQSVGRTAFDVDIDGMEEQPWRHPGVDIADFFNYGFTEDSWRVYCEKQLRNRYDQTHRRPQNAKAMVGRGTNSGPGSGGSNVRHGGGERQGRMENSLQPQRSPQAQLMPGNISGPAGSNNFRQSGPPGNNGIVWNGAGGGRGPGPDRFPPHGSFGPGPPPGRGNPSPPWFDDHSQQQHQLRQQHQLQQYQLQLHQLQQHQQQAQQHQVHLQNRQQHFGPGPGAGGRMIRPGGGGNGGNGGNMSHGDGLAADSVGMRRSRSPDPRGDGPLQNKMARLR